MDFAEDLTTSEKVIDDIGIFKGLPELPHTRGECGYSEPLRSTDKKQMELEEQMLSYVGKRVRLEVIDGRRYQGTLYCYDSLGNLVINHCVQIFQDGTKKGAQIAIVPVNTIGKIMVKLG
jgi:small nuclear ribonucleoprotein (snRNP)-like protein